MRQLLLVIAVACLATSGCAGNRMLGCRSCGAQACHITRSQSAPRPPICHTACRPGRPSCDDTSCGPCDTDCDCAISGGCDECCGGCKAGCGGSSRGGRDGRGLCPHRGGYPESYNCSASPPGGQVAYPYYTVRGPRDFFLDNPHSLGPY